MAEDEIFYGQIIKETLHAVCFKPLEPYLEEVWLPKSQIAIKKREPQAWVEMPVWLAREKGIY